MWRDPEIIILSKVTQIGKEKYHMISLICGIQKKKMMQMNLYIKLKQTHRHKKQIFGYQRGNGGEG